MAALSSSTTTSAVPVASLGTTVSAAHTTSHLNEPATATVTSTAPAHQGNEKPAPTGASTSTAGANSTSTTSSISGFKVYGTLFRVDARYQLLNPLGKGSYGVVCAAKDKDTGQSIAIKKVFPMAKRTSDARHTLREILLLQFLGKHPNIVSIHNLFTNVKDDELYIVMDLMDTDMHRVLQSSQALSESHIRYFLHQLLRGVKYLHDNGVLHRDLKPGNLLLTKTCQLKIADFGLARKTPKGSSGMTSGVPMSAHDRPRSAPARAGSSLTSSSSDSSQPGAQAAPMTEHIVTRWYRAPELMLQPDGLYDKSIDMWSVGCIFAEILGRKALFPGKNFLHQLSLIFDVIGTPSSEAYAKIKSTQAQRFIKSLGKKPKVPFRTLFPNASEEAIDLLDKLLQFDPKDRYTAQEALLHPYLQSLERKYKCNEPKPSSRIDFAFEQNRKLTRMDLRAMIIKEVENFRKAESMSGGNTEATTSTPSVPEKCPAHAGGSRPVSTAGVTPSLSQVVAQQQLKRLEKHEEDVRIAAAAAAAAVEAAKAHAHATSKIQPLNAATQGNITSNVGSIQAHVSTVVGAGRSRLRVITKPPVPKQQTAGAETSSTVNQVTVESRVMMNNFLMPRLSTTGHDDSHHSTSNEANATTAGLGNASVGSAANLNEPAPPTGASSASGPSTNEDHPYQQSHVHPHHIGSHFKQREHPHEVMQPRQKLTAINALSPSSKASSLPQPKASLAMRPSPAAPIELNQSQNNSPSSSSSSDDDDAETKRIQETIRARRASTPSAFGSSITSSAASGSSQDQKQQAGTPTNVLNSNKPQPLRRACSAGHGAKSQIDQVSTNNETSPHSPMALVGSTSSLIHAQRNNNTTHQSLTKTGELFLKKHLEKGINLDGNLPPPKSKRLTVPKSPKFSLMSWQKKHDDPLASGTTTGKRLVVGTDPLTGRKLKR